jgi:tRNA-modifying protein YgfZ
MLTDPLRLDRSILHVSGVDAHTFLQGVLTQDVARLQRAPACYAALLTPQGKVVADMILWTAPDGGVFIDADPTRGPELCRRLSMYKLRADAVIDDISVRFMVEFCQRPFSGAAPDPRAPSGALGWRKIAPQAEAKHLDSGADAFARMRIAFGAPDLARDADAEEVFALEALLEELNGVDFQKGCFVGQENVSRMKRRATTRKKFCPVEFDADAPPHGTPIRANDAELGSVRSSIGRRALAFLRLDRALAAREAGQTLTADGAQARLDPPSWLLAPPP